MPGSSGTKRYVLDVFALDADSSSMKKESHIEGPMHDALIEARAAAARGEVPVGAVVMHQGMRIAASGNRVEERLDPTAHAEILALREAARVLATPYLEECDLYVTLEPCALCAAAISFFRVRRLYFGAYDPKGGAVDHGPRFYQQPTCHHRPHVYGGLSELQCAEMLRAFFAKLRQD